MPADIVTTPASVVDTHAEITVELKSNLVIAEDWTATTGLYCDRLETRVNGFDSAALHYQCGDQVKQIEGAAFAEATPLDVADSYCRVTVGPPGNPTSHYRWHGVVVDDEVSNKGVFLDGGVRKFRFRDQSITVLGLEYLLDRQPIGAAIVHDTTRLERTLVFNGGALSGEQAGRAGRGNRHTEVNADGVYAFSKAPNADEWTAADIVKYLLKYFAPVDNAGDPLPTLFSLTAGSATLLSGYKPKLDPRGLTVMQALNAIINPKRGFCWWVEYDETVSPNGAASIVVESLANTLVTLPSSATLPANTRQKAVDMDLDPTVDRVRRRSDRRKRYDQVLCRGARMTSTFTLGFGDSTLAIDWEAAAATAYANAAKPGEAGAALDAYNALTDEEKAKQNDAYRRSALLNRVYTCYRIPDDWDRKSGDGKSASGRDWTFGDVSASGSIAGELPIVINGLRILETTMLREGVDYTDPANPVDNNPDGSEVNYVAPFAIVKVATSPDGYAYADKLNNYELADGDAVGDVRASYNLFAQERAPGIVLQSSSGLNHTIAKDRFDPGTAEPTATLPEVDYETIRVTVSAEADKFCEAIYPASASADTPVEVLEIYLGDSYRLDFLPGNTVVDVRGGEVITCNDTTNAGRLLRDDRQKLSDLAQLAYQWYQTERASVSARLNQTHPLFELGTLVTTIGDAETAQTVNSVIGVVAYDFKAGSQSIITLGDAVDFPGLLT